MSTFLDELMNNACNNVKLHGHEKNYLSKCKNYLIDIIKDLLGHKYDIEIINQGSYATHTQIYVSSDTDFDIDIGILFKNIQHNITPHMLRNVIYKLLLKDERVKKDFKYVNNGTICVKVFLRAKHSNIKIKFEICVYKFSSDILHFGLGGQYKNIWKADDKKTQMTNIKAKIAEFPILRKFIIFLKCFVSGNEKIKNCFKSIIITELFVQYYKKKFKNFEESLQIIFVLQDALDSLCKKNGYYLNTSGQINENLLDNEFRQINRNLFIDCLESIVVDFYQVYSHGNINKCEIIYDNYSFSSASALCPKLIYALYNSTHPINRCKINKTIESYLECENKLNCTNCGIRGHTSKKCLLSYKMVY
jgi:hypothetical protein